MAISSLSDLRAQRARQLQTDESDDARSFGDSFLTLDELKKQNDATKAKMAQQLFENNIKTQTQTRENTAAADAHARAPVDLQHLQGEVGAQADTHSKSVQDLTEGQQKIDTADRAARSTAVEQVVSTARARGAKDLHDLALMPDLQSGLAKFEGKSGSFPEIEAEFQKQKDDDEKRQAQIDLLHAQANKDNRAPLPRVGPAGAQANTAGERKSADDMITGMIQKAQTGDINWGAAGAIAGDHRFPTGMKSQDRQDLDSQAAQLTGEWANLVVQTKRMPNKAEMEMIRDTVLPTLGSTISREDYVHRLQDVQKRLRRIQADEASAAPQPGNSSRAVPPGTGTPPAAAAQSGGPPPRDPKAETNVQYFHKVTAYFHGDAHQAMKWIIANDPTLGGAAKP